MNHILVHSRTQICDSRSGCEWNDIARLSDSDWHRTDPGDYSLS